MARSAYVSQWKVKPKGGTMRRRRRCLASLRFVVYGVRVGCGIIETLSMCGLGLICLYMIFDRLRHGRITSTYLSSDRNYRNLICNLSNIPTIMDLADILHS